MHAITRSQVVRLHFHSEYLKRENHEKGVLWEWLGSSTPGYIYEYESTIIIVMSEYGRPRLFSTYRIRHVLSPGRKSDNSGRMPKAGLQGAN